jgi:EAL domain-containing protein (putative c-di-GMP-specific phosphodiesterase class I)
MELGLRAAIDNYEIQLHYQPQVTNEGHVIGLEALVRWEDPHLGMISPVEFIPLAETSGLICLLGQRVLEMACQQLALWSTQSEMAHLSIAVNVSTSQFHQKDFVHQVLSVLQRTGANPLRLKLEITESMLAANVEDVIAKMNALKDVGIDFSLDDFGTGYSSLAYLKRLPLTQLKIDQSFVRDILIDPNDVAIASMIIALSASMGLLVIAEGVETQSQHDKLSELGCLYYQGYLFSRPLRAQAVESFVRSAP